MRNKMFRTKIIVALALAGMMCFQVTGCGKSDSKKKKEKLDQYGVVSQGEINHSLATIRVEDGELYGSYYDFNTSADEPGDMEGNAGLIKYNLETKETKEVKADEDVYLNTVLKDKDGNYIAKGSVSVDTDSEDNDNDGKNDTYSYYDVTYKYDKDFNLVDKVKGDMVTENINDAGGTDASVAQEYTTDGDLVELCMSAETTEYYIKITDKDGNEKGKIECDGDQSFEALLKLPDGEVLVSKWGSDKDAFYKIDLDNLKIGEKVFDIPGYDANQYCAGKDNTLICATEGYIYRINYKDNKATKIIKLLDSDINPDNVQAVYELSDGTIGCIVSEDSDTTGIYTFEKQDSNKSGKTEIKLGVLYLDSELQERVIKFNKTNDKYRIVTVEYYDDEEEDYANVISRFNSDIASGNCPDIIDFSSMEGYLERYDEKGLLEDLTPYFNKEEDIKLDKLVQSVVNTYKINGKLYVLPQCFTLSGWFGATDTVGKDIHWTLDDFINLTKSLPDGVEMIKDLTSDSLLSMCTTQLDRYINWETGDCRFNSDEFVKLLEFSGNYKSSDEFYKDYDDSEYVDESTLIRQNKLILQNAFLTDVDDYMVAKAIYGKDISFKGAPVDDGNGVMVSGSGSLLAISSKSKNKDVAWEFIKQFYIPEDSEERNFSSYAFGFPIIQSELDKKLEDAKTPDTYTDENGNEQVSENVWTIGDVEVKVGVASDDDIKAIKDIINSIDGRNTYDVKIGEMITEEAEAFFKGQKTAKEVADIIQSRISMYVKENK
ncbi:MAG: extracellular solute-binding protein [Lachnospiraceae bacterium]|nr:extracellular solute-binding protein [Clostridiales bacterium]MDD6292868.1 extracellular solute-binding protein [Eubacteriales bacterium]MDY2607685.1 extracellular solute-binding protein [Lachnospiraceae bacterium]